MLQQLLTLLLLKIELREKTKKLMRKQMLELKKGYELLQLAMVWWLLLLLLDNTVDAA